MWNHTPNCSPGGGENNELDSNLFLKERIEKSLDLNHYLKYLDHLFGQTTSESDASDSDECERRTIFTEFRQPSTTFQSQDRSQQHGLSQNNHLLLGPPNTSEINNHLNNFTAVKPTDSYYVESNISSSLSSSDSGASPVSLSLSSENFLDPFHNKLENSANGVTKSAAGKRNSVTGAEEEMSGENSPEKEKKVQKKKKSAKGSSETFSRHHKPSSGGKGSSGSKGGGGSSASGSGGGSNDNAGDSSGSSSNQNTSGNNESPGSKSRSGNQSLEKQNDSIEDIVTDTEINSRYHISDNENSHFDSSDNSAHLDLQRALGIRDSNVDTFILNEDFIDSFEADESFPMNSILDNIRDDEASISDFISVSTSLHSENSSPSSILQRSTNIFGKIAEAVVASVNGPASQIICSGNTTTSDPSKSDVKRRKTETKKDPLDKSSNLTEKQKQSKIELLNAKRRKIYVFISRRECVKEQKTRAINFKESLAMKRKLAQACARQVKKNAIQSQKCTKESICKAKRLTQEMEVYWKSVEKCERDLQRKLERESEGKLKKTSTLNSIRDTELFYLISLIERFVNKLLGEFSVAQKDEKYTDLTYAVQEDNIQGDIGSLNRNKELTSQVDSIINSAVSEHYSLVNLLDRSGIFRSGGALVSCKTEKLIYHDLEKFLMKHQIFGVNWIENLYKKGLNGILADESGLGKKVQAIGFLNTLVESYNLWGPFLIVTPTTSLISWEQELRKMCPTFKVLLYTGKHLEKLTLQRIGTTKETSEDTACHIVVTTYQAMANDLKYFNKTDWQYLILDDSQNVITSGTNWMALLSFRCRNKLLLCGNPQLHSFQHICSYLYFVIPSLFDSHKELSELLLTGLESPVIGRCDVEENRSGPLSKLHAVLQHFLLRRELRDVEIEPMTYCGENLKCRLSKKQQKIYSGLLGKAALKSIVVDLERCPLEELKKRVKIVLDLSLQLEKVCNHPDLIEETCYTITPLWTACSYIALPYLIYKVLPSKMEDQTLLGLFCIYSALNMYTSLFGKSTKYTNDVFKTWSFVRFLDLSWNEVEELYLGRHAARLNYLVNSQSVLERIQYNTVWTESQKPAYLFYYPTALTYNLLSKSKIFSMLVFTSRSPVGGSWKKCKPLSMVNTIQQRTLKSKNYFRKIMNLKGSSDCFAQRFTFPSVEYPGVLQCYSSAVHSEGFQPYISCKRDNEEVAAMLNWSAILKMKTNTTDEYNLPNNELIQNLKDCKMTFNWSHGLLSDRGSFIGDSGKMEMLDALLARLKECRHHVLLVSFMRDDMSILQEFLRIRKWKYAQLTDKNSKKKLDKDVFVYLMYGHEPVQSDAEITFKTVIFYDDNGDSKFEDQKKTVLKKFSYRENVDFYRIICSGTIEERMPEFIEERKILSETLSNGLKSERMSVVATLKDFVSILMHGYEQKEEKRYRSSEVTSLYQIHACNMNDLNVQAYSGEHCLVKFDSMRNDNEGFDSTSPSCSEEQDAYIYEEDDGRGVTECHDNDHFSLSFDEGYMGMSPDSFEDTPVKSDYEEHNVPKKPKLGRGAGKRGRPPSRSRFHRRDPYDSSEIIRRGPGRPRLKTVGPVNQGTRGRKPGRPPLTRRAEPISSCLTSLSPGQNVFGFYSSSDVTLS